MIGLLLFQCMPQFAGYVPPDAVQDAVRGDSGHQQGGKRGNVQPRGDSVRQAVLAQ